MAPVVKHIYEKYFPLVIVHPLSEIVFAKYKIPYCPISDFFDKQALIALAVRLKPYLNNYLGEYTSTNRRTRLTEEDIGKYIYLTDTEGIVFWLGDKWSDQ